ncbi:MAG: hypothetical protein NTV58_19450 [Deltaproteobacteria bacterium]|nr:hypothetical protein [Deltaproteobacteria bacterium]
MSINFSEIRKLTTEELIEKYDKIASTTSASNVGINFYLQEIYRRDNEKLNDKMLEYTKGLHIMTIIITVATIINVAAVVYSILK